MLIGSKLKRLRELKNLNQEEIAKKLNITKQAYSKIERNETKLDIDRLKDLSEIFEIPLDELLKLDENSINLNHAKECDSPNQFTGTMSTVNNFYYGNEMTPILEKTIQTQQEIITRLENEVAFLRKTLEGSLEKK